MPNKGPLVENKIAFDPDDYAAAVQIRGSADGDLVQDIIDQAWTVNKPDILTVTAALKPACHRGGRDSLDKLHGVRSPGKPVTKLRSTVAPCSAQASALKKRINTVLTEVRTAPHRDRRSISLCCGGDFGLVVRRAGPTGLAE